jgi:hypothetical protein
MIFKNLLLATVLFVLLFSSFLKVKGQAPPTTIVPCMKTNNLDLNSGYNHELNAWYGKNAVDEYWGLVSAQGVSVPRCATVWGAWTLGGSDWGPMTNCRALSVVTDGGGVDPEINATTIACNLKNGKDMFTFRRSFWVDIPTGTTIPATLNLKVVCDDRLNNVILNTPLGITSGSCATTTTNVTVPITLKSGRNDLDLDVLNRQLSLSTGTSPMQIKVEASIVTTQTVPPLVKNYYYKPNLGGCGSQMTYMQYPKFKGHCIPPPGSSGPVTITNYNPAYTYSISSGSISSAGVFTGTLGSTYTITVTDATSCSITSSIKIIPNNIVVNILAASPTTCITPGTMTTKMWTVTGGTSPYTSYCPTALFLSSNPLDLPVGTHTVTVTDAKQCDGKASVSIGNLFSINNTATPPCANPGKITPVNSPSAIAGGIAYKINSGAYTTTLPLNIGTAGAGIYTITAKDIYGCTATNTIQMFPNPVVSASYSNSCPPTFTATPLGLSSYTWTGVPFSSATTNPYTPTMNTNYAGLINSVYTVTATDIKGCVGSSTKIFTANPFCCGVYSQCYPSNNPQYYYGDVWNQTTAIKFSTIAPFSNNSTADLLAAFGNPVGNIITTNAVVVFDGTMPINQSVTFKNCPNLLFTQTAQMMVSGNSTLTFDNCVLRSQCHSYPGWGGIGAYYVGNKIVIKNNTIIKDMRDGVTVAYGAGIDCSYSSFLNNNIGIQILYAPLGYNYINGNCKILNTLFSGEYNYTYPNCPGVGTGEIGIKVTQSQEVQIGLFNNGQNMNTFKSLRCGIYIWSNFPTQTERYYVYDNQFEDIFGSTSTSNYWGSGVHATCTTPNILKHTLFVRNSGENSNMTPKFINCSKAIVTNNTSAHVLDVRTQDCPYGFMLENANNQLFNIRRNLISNATVGMQFNGNTYKSSYVGENNEIHLNPLAGNPSGINVKYVLPTAFSGIKIENNYITISSNAGIGISLMNTNLNTLLYKNTVDNFNTTPSPVNNGNVNFGVSGIPIAAHYLISQCNNSRIIENRSNGSNALLTGGVNNIEGMRIDNSKNCEFSCNRFNKTRIGTMVTGNCTGTNFRGNKFTMHGNGLRFQDLGAGASMDNIGGLFQDNNNQFTSSSLFTAPFNTTLFRFATTPTPFAIFTNASITSSSTTAGANYNILGTSGTPYNGCLATSSFMSMIPDNNGGIFTETDAVAIAEESGQYADFSEVGKWIEDGKLYCDLADGDLNMANNPTLTNFYAAQNATFRDELYHVDKLIEGLSDSVAYEDTTITFAERVMPIRTYNNAIVSTNELEANEQYINDIYLTWLEGGIASIDTTDSVKVALLAMSCPLQQGTAVYKARLIYASYDPSINFDDIAICQSTVANKGGISQGESIDMNLLANVMENEITVYPNPATDEVTIDYVLHENSKGKITLFDIVGRARMTLDLSATQNRIKVNVGNLEKGIYIYKYIVDNKIIQTDKLTIE